MNRPKFCQRLVEGPTRRISSRERAMEYSICDTKFVDLHTYTTKLPSYQATKLPGTRPLSNLVGVRSL